jgi:hypothetical protein
VLGIIDRVGRPDPRSQPESSEVATIKKIKRKRENEKTKSLRPDSKKIFSGYDPDPIAAPNTIFSTNLKETKIYNMFNLVAVAFIFN